MVQKIKIIRFVIFVIISSMRRKYLVSILDEIEHLILTINHTCNMIKLHRNSFIINDTISLTFVTKVHFIISYHTVASRICVPQLRKTIIESATRNNISQNNFHGSHTIINVYDLFIHF